MAQYQIKITEQAKEHLYAIRDYIAQDLQQPHTAKQMLKSLKAEIMSLAFMPYRVKCIEEQPWGNLGFRKIRVNNHYIYFWMNEDKKQVHIIAVIYVGRDQERQLSILEL